MAGRTARRRHRGRGPGPEADAGRMAENRPASIIRLPGRPTSVDIALDELEAVYAFVFRRVGNRADAEDVTQQVALKAVPRLHEDASRESQWKHSEHQRQSRVHQNHPPPRLTSS